MNRVAVSVMLAGCGQIGVAEVEALEQRTGEPVSYAGLTLVNADSDADIGQLTEGMTVNLAAVGGRLNVRATTSPAKVGSVVFLLNGSTYRIDNGAPYTLAGETTLSSGAIDYAAWTPAAGAYMLVVRAYSKPSGTGSLRAELTVRFSVVQTLTSCPSGYTLQNGACVDVDECALGSDNCDPLVTCTNTAGSFACGSCPDGTLDTYGNGTLCQPNPKVTQLILINADTDQAIRALTSGTTLDFATLGTSRLNVRADTNPSPVGSVQFILDGVVVRTENTQPYALGGDSTSGGVSDYLAWTPALGAHTLTARAYSGASASGTVGPELTVSFTVVDGSVSACASGYTYVSGSCVDINECNAVNDCDSLAGCINDPGTYHCGECPLNYNDVHGDGTLCELVDSGSEPSLYFSGDFSNVVLKAPNTSGNTYFESGWEELRSHPYLSELYINNGAALQYVDVKIDPSFDGGRKSLFGHVIDDDPNKSGTSRFQMSMNFNESSGLTVYHTRHRMFIHPDVRHLESYPEKISWFTLVESWLERDPNMDGDPAGSARWGLAIHKPTGAGQKFYWRVQAEYMQPASIAYDDIWPEVRNYDVPVPFGQWFTMDIFIKQGYDAAGKVKITVTPDGGAPIVLFDISNTTMYPGRPDLFRKSLQPFKFYLDDRYVDFMRNAGKKLAVYYNDFKWFVD